MSKLRKSARGEECTLRLYPYCNGDPETVVLCHLPSNAGMGRKSPDWWAVYGCSTCHSIIDGRRRIGMPRAELSSQLLRALYETQSKMRDKGLIK